MTAFAFTPYDRTDEWNEEEGCWEKELYSFDWSFIHDRLCNCSNLPTEMQRGMDDENIRFWTESMGTLVRWSAQDWKSTEAYSRSYRHHIGNLWKTLEKAMNNAHLDIDLCFFICKQVMNAAWWKDCGGMSFTPKLSHVPSGSASSREGLSFVPCVQHRAQGTVPEQRNRYRASRPGSGATRRQLESGRLVRPFQAAHGILPAASSRRPPQRWW